MIEQNKKDILMECMRELTASNVAVAFSGGVDSSLLLKLAVETAASNSRIYAVTAHTSLHPTNDLQIAKRVASEVGAIHKVLYLDELNEAGILDNPIDRCYRCKYYIFIKIKELALENDVSAILEGTNMDDTKVYRPGIRAIRELGIKSPLVEAGFTKKEVRELALEYGISTASRPATPCMATRFPYKTRLTQEKLRNVELGEELLRGFGFWGFRLRVHEDVARIEIDLKQMELMLAHKEEIIKGLKKLGYQYVTLDLEGFRQGSMDEKVLSGSVKTKDQDKSL